MKALLIVFAIALCCCNSQTLGGYTQVSATDIQNSATIQSLANYGAQNIVQQALTAGKLPNSNANFKLTSINSVYQQVVNGINYRFNVTLTNSDNGVIIIAQFTINYVASSNTRQIISSNYQIPTYSLPSSTTATPKATQSQPQATQVGGYTLIPANEVQNNALIQSLANLGAQSITQQAVTEKKLPTSNSNFAISKINSVYQQVVNGINYKFNVTLTNSDGVTIYAQFVIYYQASTNTRQIASSSFSIAPYSAAPTQTPTTATPTSSTKAGGWTQLSDADIQNSAIIKSLADFGAQNIAQQIITAGKAPSNSKFTVTKINSVSSQVVNGINYNFNVNLSNADKSINVVAAYIVYYQSWTNTKKVLSSSYQILAK